MPTPASLTFPAFTDTRTLWPNVAAVNTFFNSCQVNIVAANLPVPTPEDLGAVKALEIPALNLTALNNNYVNLVIDDGGTQQKVPTKEAYDILCQRLLDTITYLQSLDAQLRAKGYVA